MPNDMPSYAQAHKMRQPKNNSRVVIEAAPGHEAPTETTAQSNMPHEMSDLAPKKLLSAPGQHFDPNVIRQGDVQKSPTTKI